MSNNKDLNVLESFFNKLNKPTEHKAVKGIYVNDKYIQIIKDLPIPIPKAGTGSLGTSIYGFHLLEVGDALKFGTEHRQNKYVCSARNYGKKANKKFTARYINGETTIWRVK